MLRRDGLAGGAPQVGLQAVAKATVRFWYARSAASTGSAEASRNRCAKRWRSSRRPLRQMKSAARIIDVSWTRSAEWACGVSEPGWLMARA